MVDRRKLERQEKDPHQKAQEQPGQRFGDDHRQKIACRCSGGRANQVIDQWRQGERHRERNEKPHLHRHTFARNTRQHHETSADTTKDDQWYQDAFVRELGHETEPSDWIWTPRLISRCDSTGSVP